MILDGRTETLLLTINSLCGAGKYEVLEEEELLSNFSKKEKMDAESLKKTMDYLVEHEYIDVKYSEEGLYCVCPLPAGRAYSERAKEVSRDGAKRRLDTVLVTAIGAFVGGFVGSLVAWLITTLL